MFSVPNLLNSSISKDCADALIVPSPVTEANPKSKSDIMLIKNKLINHNVGIDDLLDEIQDIVDKEKAAVQQAKRARKK